MAYTQLEWVTDTTLFEKANMDHLETQYDEFIAELDTHKVLDTGVHGWGGDVGATDADIATHAVLVNQAAHPDRIVVGKTSDESVTGSTVMQNDDDLYFAVGANENWIFLMTLYYSIASNASLGTKMQFTVPVAGSIVRLPDDFDTAEVGVDATISYRYDLTDRTLWVYTAWYLYIGGANAGNVQLQWAQQFSTGSPNTHHEGSFITAKKIS